MDAVMTQINISELRQHLPGFIKQVQRGEEIVVTLHGKPVARIVPERSEDAREAAWQRLVALRGSAVLGDVISPLDEVEWTADENHL
jgi:prevent-host-death family protein